MQITRQIFYHDIAKFFNLIRDFGQNVAYYSLANHIALNKSLSQLAFMFDDVTLWENNKHGHVSFCWEVKFYICRCSAWLDFAVMVRYCNHLYFIACCFLPHLTYTWRSSLVQEKGEVQNQTILWVNWFLKRINQSIISKWLGYYKEEEDGWSRKVYGSTL